MRAYSQILLVMLVATTGGCRRSDRQTTNDTAVVASSTDSVVRNPVVPTPSGTTDTVPAPTGSTTSDPDVKGVEYWRNLDPKRPPAQDFDHGFLRSMADNNEGIVQMVAFAKDRATGTATIADVKSVTDTHTRLKTELVDMIRNKYQEVFSPVAAPGNKQRLDSLDLTKPEEFNREFYQRAIEHNRQWIARLDELSPRLRDATVKSYATQLRAALQGEVDSFTRRLSGA